MSSSSGSANRCASRLAASIEISTSAPSGISVPATTTGSVVKRMVATCSGASYRSSSSIAPGSRDGSCGQDGLTGRQDVAVRACRTWRRRSPWPGAKPWLVSQRVIQDGSGMRRRDDVVDVVQSPPGGLFLEPVHDEPPDAGPAPIRADQERDLGVTPFAVQPAVAGHLAIVAGDMPPFVGDRRSRPGRHHPGRGKLLGAEQPLFGGVPARGVFPWSSAAR